MSTMPEWENDLRAALTRPGPPGRYWHRPGDWTIERAVEAMRPHFDNIERTVRIYREGIDKSLRGDLPGRPE